MKHTPSPLVLLLILALAPALRADTLYTGIGALQNVQIIGIDGDKLRFINPQGTETTRDLTGVARLEVSTEPAFNQAEEAYAAGQWDKATGGYEKTIRATNKPWLKQWSGVRLLEAAEKSGNFPAAVTAWVELVQSNPAAAAGRQPKMPEGASTFLDTAAADIDKALQGRLEDKQKAELLKLQLDIYQKQNNTAKAISTAEQLSKLTGDATDPANKRLLADLKLSLAQIAFDQKNYAQVSKEIASASNAIVMPEQQAKALYLLAEASKQLAKDDKEKLQDTAIAYMRVVAHFPRSPQAGESLMKTAAIIEQLGDAKKALSLYQQAATEYPATNAKEQVERLKAE